MGALIPAHAGIQAFFESVPRTHLNAGDRQHDGLSLHSGRDICTLSWLKTVAKSLA
jgi:hypothetical protein